jgi:GT2 family glycosyltransferase
MLSVVVLVLAWNGRDWLPACLHALGVQQFAGRWAVLVVDNGSTDGSPDVVRSEFPHAALITNPTNLGFAGGNNVGIRALLDGTAPGIDFVPDVVVLLNQDTEVASDWLVNLVAPFDRDERVGIVGCKLVFPDGTLQHAGGMIVWPLATGTHRGAGEADTGQYDQASVPDYVAAAAVAVHRRVWETVGLFDEGFAPAYYEDADLCYRARSASFGIVYTPHAVVTHHENASLQGQSPAHHRAYHRNRIRFVLKYLDPALLAAFVAAERDEIRRWSTADSLARKHAYVNGMLMLPNVLAQRSDLADMRSEYARFSTALHTLHDAVVNEEQARRALIADPAWSVDTAQHTITDVPVPTTSDAAPAAPMIEHTAAPAEAGVGHDDDGDRLLQIEVAAPPAAPQAEPAAPPLIYQQRKDVALPMSNEPNDQLPRTAPDPVDVAAVMQQIRRRISARQHERSNAELSAVLHQANEQWGKVYEPLNVAPARSLIGVVWRFFSVRLHREVRSYLDPMIFRQSELNASVVRALNHLARREPPDTGDEVEALRDELIQLRERVRQLEEQAQTQ